MTDRLHVTRLPDADDMLRRLISVDDNPHKREKFYPIILKNAGRELAGMGVVNMFVFAIHDYTQGMPPFMAVMLFDQIDDYVQALVDDEQAKAEALEMVAQVKADVASQG